MTDAKIIKHAEHWLLDEFTYKPIGKDGDGRIGYIVVASGMFTIARVITEEGAQALVYALNQWRNWSIERDHPHAAFGPGWGHCPECGTTF